MSDDHEFRIRPGRIRSTRAQQARPFVAQALAAAKKAGGGVSRSGRVTSGNRSRFGRGQRASIQANRLITSRTRGAVVKARVVRHTARSAPLGTHLDYLRRDGVTRDGEKARLFGPGTENADARAFAERCGDDRHHFRFIVSPDDAPDMADLRSFTRDLVGQMEKDLGTKLDWVDTDAANKAADADMALQELGADVAGMAYVTATITVWDADPRLADEKLRLVEKVIQGRDFTAMIETVNAVDAWLGSLPGHVYANVRQPPISTLNLAHMIPLSAVWAGPERDDHFDAPPLLYGRTEGSTPFRLSLHVGDVGHTLVVGPTGAGKSVLLALMALQFRRYLRSQVFAFDFGGSIRAAALAMGGDWHDLGGGLTEGSESSVSLQPLARIHDTYERAWAADWIVAILLREGIKITPEAKEHIWTALTSLASAPVGERTITGLSVLLQSNDLKQALRPFCVGGPYGRLLDAEAEHLGSADVQAFEIEGLVGTGAAPAVLAYLFHRIGDRLDGRPTLLIIDEGWLALDDEGFAGQLREWLKTLRKKNASVIFATQSLSDIDNSDIAPAIIESCPTRLLLPNERAVEPQITAIYRRFGLNDRQIEMLARATPKRDYYCQSRRGNRLFELGLSEVGLALCAASAKSDQTLIAEIVAEHGREGFLSAWLNARDVGWAVDLIPNVTTLIPQA